jgi:hypothetical protein
MEVFVIEKKEQHQRPPRPSRNGANAKPTPRGEQKQASAKNKGKKTWFGKGDRY